MYLSLSLLLSSSTTPSPHYICYWKSAQSSRSHYDTVIDDQWWDVAILLRLKAGDEMRGVSSAQRNASDHRGPRRNLIALIKMNAIQQTSMAEQYKDIIHSSVGLPAGNTESQLTCQQSKFRGEFPPRNSDSVFYYLEYHFLILRPILFGMAFEKKLPLFISIYKAAFTFTRSNFPSMCLSLWY
jgi:hypothetical protein